MSARGRTARNRWRAALRARILGAMPPTLLTRCARLATVVALAAVATLAALPLRAQIPATEFAARRDSLAARIGDGVVIAFGGRTPITDFGPFYQLTAFHYLTNFDEPDAAFVMVVQKGRGASTLFLTPVGARRAFYYGRRPDSATVVNTLGHVGALVRRARALRGFPRGDRRRVLLARRLRRRRLRGRGLADARRAVH